MTAQPFRTVRRRRAFRVAAVVAALLAAVTATAIAEYVPSGSFSGPGAADGGLDAPRRAAVEQSSGNLFVVDAGNDRVQVFSRDGGSGAYLTQFGGGVLDDPFGIAIDESGGQTVVYVSSASNGGEVVRFESDEQVVPTFTVDAAYSSPARGAGADQVQSFASPIALAPNGDLWVADRGAEAVKRFDPSGAHVAGSNIDGASSGTAFTGLLDLAVDPSGDLIVVDETGDIATQAGTSRVERFAPDGTHQHTIGPVGQNQRPASVAVDPSSANVVVSGEQDAVYRDSYPTLHVYDPAATLLQELSLTGSAQYTRIQGLAIDDTRDRLYAVLDSGTYFGAPYGTPGIQAFDDLFPPQATIDPIDPATVTATNATFTGTVDPNGQQTDWHFEYRLTGTTDWTPTTTQNAGQDTDPITVTTTPTNLQPNRDYQVRLTATNTDGQHTTNPQTFHTNTAPPTISPIAGSGRTTTAVRLNSAINPNGLPATYHFEWGTDTGYGNRIPATGTQSAGSGSRPVRYSKPIDGLQPGTTIHYRVVAVNAAGAAIGPDQTVETLGAPVAYEMVSPTDKNGGAAALLSAQVAPSGETASFVSTAGFAGTPGNVQVNLYRSERSPTGWTTRSLTLPQTNPNGTFKNAAVKGLSEDLSHAFQLSTRPLVPGAVEGYANYFLRDIADDSMDFIGADQDTFGFSTSSEPFLAATPNGSHFLFRSTAAFTPDSVAGERNIYLYENGDLSLVNRLPDGSYAFGAEAGGSNRWAERVMSDDGSRIFFSTASGVYMRENDQTVPISISEVDDDGSAHPATFAGASADGSIVYLLSDLELTTDADPSVGRAVFRYDVDDRDMTYVSVPDDVTWVNGVNRVSEDGSYAYFNGGEQPLDRSDLFVYRDGETKTIAELEEPVSSFSAEAYALSDNGRYFAFQSGTKDLAGMPTTATGSGCDENPLGGTTNWTPGRCLMAYVYDAQTAELVCASCDPIGTRPTKHVGFNTNAFESTGGYIRRHVLDDGTFFYESYDRLVPEDVNDKRDVYRWRDGQLDLVSTGRSGGNSGFGDVTADGRNVFLFTSEKLVTQDVDDQQDLYVARVNGGIAAQNPSAPVPPCEGLACQGPEPSAPERVDAGSKSVAGSGDVLVGPRPRATLGSLSIARSLLARRGRATVAVRVNRAGRVSLVARAKLRSGTRTVAHATRYARKAGEVKLTLRLSRAARRQLAGRGRLRVSLAARFSGQARSDQATLTLVRRGARRATVHAPADGKGR